MDQNSRYPMSGGGEGQQGRDHQGDGLVEQAADAARKVYGEGERYLREGLDHLPEMNRVVSRPVQENPLISILLAGAMGYLLAYLVHGPYSQWSHSGIPDYARTRGNERSRY